MERADGISHPPFIVLAESRQPSQFKTNLHPIEQRPGTQIMFPEEETVLYSTRRPLEAGPAQEPIGIILHRDGIIVDLNAETAALFGYERHELIGFPLKKLVKQWDSSTMDGSHPGALKAIHKNGTVFTLQLM